MATLAVTLATYRMQRACHISTARAYLHQAANDRRHTWGWLAAYHYAKAQQHRRWAADVNRCIRDLLTSLPHRRTTMTLIPETCDCRTFVLSAMRDDNPADQNHHYHTALTRRLGEELSLGHVFAVLQCDGRYQGADERSLAVIAPREWADTAVELGKQYEQDSILAIKADGIGKLLFMDGRSGETIGQYLSLDDYHSSWLEGRDFTTVLGTGHRFTFV